MFHIASKILGLIKGTTEAQEFQTHCDISGANILIYL